MAVIESNPPSRGTFGFSRATVVLLLGITLYAAAQVSMLLTEIEAIATGPRPADVEGSSVLFTGFAFILLMLLSGVLVDFAIPKGSLLRVKFWAHASIVGFQLYSLYTRYHLMLVSYCYNALKESPRDPLLAIVCPKIFPLSWEHAALPALSGAHYGPRFAVTVYQVCILFTYSLIWMRPTRPQKDDKASSKSLSGETELNSPLKGVTVADLNLKPVVAAKSSTTIKAFIDLLDNNDVDQIPLALDESEMHVALVTRGDLVSFLLRGRGTLDTPMSQVVLDLTSRRSSMFGTNCVTPDVTLSDLSTQFEHSSAAVVMDSSGDGRKAVHVVTKLDLLGYLARQNMALPKS